MCFVIAMRLKELGIILVIDDLLLVVTMITFAREVAFEFMD